MIIEEKIGDVKELKLYYEGSDRPADDHQIIGIRYLSEKDGHFRWIGDFEKMRTFEKSISI